jgi:hypothetical protein
MKYILTFVLFAFFSCSSEKEIIGYYRSDNSGKSIGLIIDNNNEAIISLVEFRQIFIDTVEWIVDKDLICLTQIDTGLINFGDSIGTFSFPSRGLFAKDYLLFYLDKTFFVFYKIEKTKKRKVKYQDEFYYVSKQVSGEEERLIKKYFGDSNQIINYLNP